MGLIRRQGLQLEVHINLTNLSLLSRPRRQQPLKPKSHLIEISLSRLQQRSIHRQLPLSQSLRLLLLEQRNIIQTPFWVGPMMILKSTILLEKNWVEVNLVLPIYALRIPLAKLTPASLYSNGSLLVRMIRMI